MGKAVLENVLYAVCRHITSGITVLSLKSIVSTRLPKSVREMIWCLTDSEYRGKLRSIRELRRRQVSAAKQIAAQTGGIVSSGPFAGMAYPTDGRFPQKLLGTYELELHSILDEISNNNYERVIDIGAAEGFYVCGCARMFPAAIIIAFEANGDLHSTIRELSELNGVAEKVKIRGLCEHTDLARAIEVLGRTLIVCDVEGAENELLDPNGIPRIKQADLIVEVHDHLCDGTSQRLRERFSPTHSIKQISSMPRLLGDFPTSVSLPTNLIAAAMDESRHPGSQWFWMTAKNR